MNQAGSSEGPFEAHDPGPSHARAEKLADLHDDLDRIAELASVAWLAIILKFLGWAMLLTLLLYFGVGRLLLGLFLWASGIAIARREDPRHQRLAYLKAEIAKLEASGARSL